MLVKFTGVASKTDNTKAVTFNDGRPNLVLGGVPGEITAEELAGLTSRGLVLEEVDLDGQTLEELALHAEELGVEHKGVKKSTLIDRIKDALGDNHEPATTSKPVTGSSGTTTTGATA